MQLIERGENWPPTQLRCIRDDTAITIHSLELDGDTLVKIAASITAAPTTPTTL